MEWMVVGCIVIRTVLASGKEPAGVMYVIFYHSGQVFPDKKWVWYLVVMHESSRNMQCTYAPLLCQMKN